MAAAFVGACAAGIPAWWLALFQSPAWRRFFVPDDAWPSFRLIIVPDALLAVATGVVAAQMLRARVSMLFAVTLGAWMYATAFSIAWAMSVAAPIAGPALMLVALVGLLVVWYAVVPTRQTGSR